MSTDMIDKLFPKDYFKDRPLMLATGAAVTMMAFIVARVLISVKDYDFKITTGYTQYGADTFIRGEWYELYEPAFFALITTVITVMLSLRVFRMNRNLSFGVIGLQLIVLAFLLIVTTALLGASAIVS